jgi:hypothetical protein
MHNIISKRLISTSTGKNINFLAIKGFVFGEGEKFITVKFEIIYEKVLIEPIQAKTSFVSCVL